jgi:GntR family transcriptional regulator of vanillate catabolism
MGAPEDEGSDVRAERRAAPKPARIPSGDRSMYSSAEGSPAPQAVKAQLALRELILGGELKAGTRIAELWLVERLNVSRTPVRLALVKLAEEGLLDALISGGYAVKDFSESDIHDAIEVRGTMEGLAARFAAERGVSAVLIAEARECLDLIDAALAEPELTDATFSVYVEQNARFHALLSEMADSPLVSRQLEKATALPFASPNGFVMAQASGPHARDILVVAQAQHRMVIEAIVQREGARAESLMREHARIARRNLQQALQSHKTLQLVPGASLIRRRSAR